MLRCIADVSILPHASGSLPSSLEHLARAATLASRPIQPSRKAMDFQHSILLPRIRIRSRREIRVKEKVAIKKKKKEKWNVVGASAYIDLSTVSAVGALVLTD